MLSICIKSADTANWNEISTFSPLNYSTRVHNVSNIAANLDTIQLEFLQSPGAAKKHICFAADCPKNSWWNLYSHGQTSQEGISENSMKKLPYFLAKTCWFKSMQRVCFTNPIELNQESWDFHCCRAIQSLLSRTEMCLRLWSSSTCPQLWQPDPLLCLAIISHDLKEGGMQRREHSGLEQVHTQGRQNEHSTSKHDRCPSESQKERMWERQLLIQGPAPPW